MDLYEKLTSGLEPLGGKLFVDGFIAALRDAARRQKEARAAPAPEGPAPTAASVQPGPRPAPESRNEPPPVGSESGKLRLEVEDFMKRDDGVETDDAEIQEFLKEKSGFDPTELD